MYVIMSLFIAIICNLFNVPWDIKKYGKKNSFSFTQFFFFFGGFTEKIIIFNLKEFLKFFKIFSIIIYLFLCWSCQDTINFIIYVKLMRGKVFLGSKGWHNSWRPKHGVSSESDQTFLHVWKGGGLRLEPSQIFQHLHTGPTDLGGPRTRMNPGRFSR